MSVKREGTRLHISKERGGRETDILFHTMHTEILVYFNYTFHISIILAGLGNGDFLKTFQDFQYVFYWVLKR